MTNDKQTRIDSASSCGNVFEDLGLPDAERLKALSDRILDGQGPYCLYYDQPKFCPFCGKRHCTAREDLWYLCPPQP